MTVSTQGVRLAFTGNGVTTTFPCTGVPANSPTDYVVELQTGTSDPVPQNYGSQYTVTGSFPGEGTVVMATAPAVGQTLWIRRSTPSIQPTDFQPAARLSSETLEQAFDRLAMRVQELEERLLSMPKIPYHLVTPGTDPGTRAPVPVDNQLLVGKTGYGWEGKDAFTFIQGLGFTTGGGGGGGGGPPTFPLLAPAGSASAPSYSWGGYSNYGFWRDADVIVFSRAGSQDIRLGTDIDFLINGLGSNEGLLKLVRAGRTSAQFRVAQNAPDGRTFLTLEGRSVDVVEITGSDQTKRVTIAGRGGAGPGYDITAYPYRVKTDGTGDLSAGIAAAIAHGIKSIYVPPGTYLWNSPVTIPPQTQIVGAGPRQTIVNVNVGGASAFAVFDLNTDTSWDTDWAKSAMSGFRFHVTGASGILVKGHEILLDDLHFHGGAAGGWAIDLLNTNEFVVERVNIGKGGGSFDWSGSGILVRIDRGTPDGKAVNFGDGVIRDSVIKLKSSVSGQIGIALDGSGYSPTSGTNKPLINNVLVSGVHVNAGSTIPTNSIGIYLRQVSRCSFVNVDVEKVAVGFKLRSAYIGGNSGSNQYNNFIGCYCLNCTQEWLDVGDTEDGGGTTAGGLRNNFVGCFFIGPAGDPSGPDYGFQNDDENGLYTARRSPIDWIFGGTTWWCLPSNGRVQVGGRCTEQGRFLFVGDINYSPNPGAAPYDGMPKNNKPRKAIGFDFGENEVRIFRPWGTAEATDARITIGNGPSTTGLSGNGTPATPLHHIKLADPVYFERWPAGMALPSGGSIPGYGSNVPDIVLNASDLTPLGTIQDWQGPGLYSKTVEGAGFRWVRVAPRPGFVKAQLARSGTAYALDRDMAGKFTEFTPSAGAATLSVAADLIAAGEATNAAGYSTSFFGWIKNRSGAGHNVTISPGSGVTLYDTSGTGSIASYDVLPGKAVMFVYTRTGAGTARMDILPFA